MKVTELYGSQYMNASDLDSKPASGTITEVGIDTLKSQEGIVRKRIVLRIDGWPKPFVVNSTNAQRLAASLGDDTDGWLGQDVSVSKQPVQFAGRLVDGVCLIPAEGEA